jgi:hypothetical protein
MKKFTPVLCLALLATAGCTGMRQAEGQFTVHSTTLRLFGFPVFGDDQANAADMVKKNFPNAQQVTTMSSPADWTSFYGVLGNLFAFNCTVISGKTGS